MKNNDSEKFIFKKCIDCGRDVVPVVDNSIRVIDSDPRINNHLDTLSCASQVYYCIFCGARWTVCSTK
jgi:hypothetical protein